MRNKIIYIILSLILISKISANEIGVVNTDVLLIKKYPNNNAQKLAFYKMNDLVEIIDKTKDENSNMWYKTNKGFVKAKFVILEKELPTFLNDEDVDFDKNAIQLIVFNLNAKRALINLKKILRNENNIYVQRTSRAQVVYIANFNSYREALKKHNELKKYYKTNFITKIKNKSFISKQSNVIIKKQERRKDIILNKKINKMSDKNFNNEYSNLDKNIEDEIGDIDVDKQMAEFDDISESVQKNNVYKENKKDIYSVNKVRTLVFNKNNDEIKNNKIKEEILDEVKIDKNINNKYNNIILKPKKEVISKKIKIEKPKKEIIIKKKIENSFYNVQTYNKPTKNVINNGDRKNKTTSRFNLRVFDHSNKHKVKSESINNNYFSSEIKRFRPKKENIVEKTYIPKVINTKIEKKVIKKEIKKENLTDKIESLLMSL